MPQINARSRRAASAPPAFEQFAGDDGEIDRHMTNGEVFYPI
jgi:hypothetical protein